MSFISALHKKYIIAEAVKCPKCHKDLTEEESVLRTDDRGGDQYNYGHYDMKWGNFTSDDHGKHRSDNYVDQCANCEETLLEG